MRENSREQTLKLARKFSWKGGPRVSGSRGITFITQKYTITILMTRNLYRNADTFRAV